MFVPVFPDASKQTEKKDVDKELQQNDRQEETEGQIPEAMTGERPGESPVSGKTHDIQYIDQQGAP